MAVGHLIAEMVEKSTGVQASNRGVMRFWSNISTDICAYLPTFCQLIWVVFVRGLNSGGV